MKARLWLAGIAMAGLLTPANFAQQAPDRTERLEKARNWYERANTSQMYEDIEIMRRLIGAKLTRDGATTNLTYSTWLRNVNNQQVATTTADPSFQDVNYYSPHRLSGSAVDGAYLDGKGVIFTLTLPESKRDHMPSQGTSAPAKSVSEWERARQALHGENPAPATKADAPAPSTADLILAVLAENGKHLRLKDSEDVVVVVTFRPTTSALTSNQNPFDYVNVATTYPKLVGQTATALAQSAYNVQPANPASPGGQGQSARDFLLLGDLHLRQQQYRQALEAYQKAAKQEPNADPKQLAETYRKLAETKIHLGDLDEAKKMLDSAVEWEKKAKTPDTEKPKSDPAAPAAPRWPTRLIITAHKRHLDEVGSGKTNLEEFRKNTKIELVTPPATK